MIVQEIMTVGYSNLKHELWFSPEFMRWMRERGSYRVPVGTWVYDDTVDPPCIHGEFTNVRRVWRLTDQYDEDGYRLGLWPD